MTPRPLLLDTNVVIALVRNASLGKHIAQAFELHRPERQVMVSIVSHGELGVFARLNGWGGKRVEELQKILRRLAVVDIRPRPVIQAYIEIDLLSQRHPAGSRNMGKNDLWIAACAKAAGAELLTTDRDFEHLAGHLAVRWVDPQASA